MKIGKLFFPNGFLPRHFVNMLSFNFEFNLVPLKLLTHSEGHFRVPKDRFSAPKDISTCNVSKNIHVPQRGISGVEAVVNH